MKLNDLLLTISLQSQEIRFAVGLAFGYNGTVFSNIACHRSASVITQSSSCQLFIHFSLIEI